MIRIHDVPASLVPDLWDAIEPLLSPALKRHPLLIASDVLQILLAGKAQLILVMDEHIVGAAVMQAIPYPRGANGNVLALGGVKGFNRKYLAQVTDHLEKWAVRNGCTTLSMLGRPGWSRFAAQRGGKTLALIVAWKPLTPAAS